MTFKDEVDATGERFWKSAYEDRLTDILDACVEKIDELERDLDNVRAATVHTDKRMDKLEVKLFNLSISANHPPVEIPTKVSPIGGTIKLKNISGTDREFKVEVIQDSED